MADLSDELKQDIIKKYQSKDPTADTSTEIVKELAEELSDSPNRIRMILIQAGVYIKKGTATEGSKTASATTTKRVSKEDQISALKAAIESLGKNADDDILDKLTGKAAAYFTEVLKK